MLTHDCPGGCGRDVQYDYLSCRVCWYRLPLDLRNAVWDSWKVRDMKAHGAALKDARQWYVANPVAP